MRTVYIIDDDETALIIAEEVLTAEGFEVETYHDSETALQIVFDRSPDIVVLDVMMPKMDGYEFCVRMRQNEKSREIPVLITTGLDDTESITKAYEAGATNFAAKPINWNIEVSRLRYMLRGAEVTTALRAKEKEARQTKADWEQTFNSIQDIVTVLDNRLNILRCNTTATTRTGRPDSEILGQSFSKIFELSEESSAECPIQAALETGLSQSVEVNYANPKGIFLVSASPVFDSSGNITRIVHVARDITEQKEMETEYYHAQKMEALGTFAGGIAHDFNNILQIVTANTELVLRTQAWDENALEDIFSSAKKGSDLTQHLLTFSRKNAVRTEKRRVNLNELVRGFLTMLERVITQDVVVEFSPSHAIGDLMAIPGQLEQVLMNLCINASHAMPNGGQLRIQTSEAELDREFCKEHSKMEPGNYLVLTVTDTGLGMDKETLESIYDPFFTTKEIGVGTGLGLSVVFGIVKRHDGCILCKSQLGHGTTFHVYLPTGVVNTENESTEDFSLETKACNEEVLVVVDDPSVRNGICRELKTLGYNPVSVSSGSAALRMYQGDANKFDLVILDIGMPGMNGWECLTRLVAADEDVRVLLATGFGGDDLVSRAREHGASGILMKPFTINDLGIRVRQTLDRGADFLLRP